MKCFGPKYLFLKLTSTTSSIVDVDPLITPLLDITSLRSDPKLACQNFGNNINLIHGEEVNIGHVGD